MRGAALIAIAVIVVAHAAVADTIVCHDQTDVTGTVAGFGKDETFEQHHDTHWTAEPGAHGVAVTIGKVADRDLKNGAPDVASMPATRHDLERTLAFEAKLVGLITGKTFTPDVPVGFTADELRGLDGRPGVVGRTLVVTLSGTHGDVAHYRIWANFGLGSIALSGSAVLAGTMDLDTRRHALVDVRVSAVVVTTGLARFDAKASAHLTRRYR